MDSESKPSGKSRIATHDELKTIGKTGNTDLDKPYAFSEDQLRARARKNSEAPLYHGSPTAGLKRLKPFKHNLVDNAPVVFATPSREFAAAMAVRSNFDDLAVMPEGKGWQVEELKPGKLSALDAPGSLYTIPGETFKAGDPRTFHDTHLSSSEVDVLDEEKIENVKQWLLERGVKLVPYGEVQKRASSKPVRSVHYSRKHHPDLRPLSYEELLKDRTNGRWEKEPEKAKQYVDERRQTEDAYRKKLKAVGHEAPADQSFLYSTIPGKEQFGQPGYVAHEFDISEEELAKTLFDVVGLPDELMHADEPQLGRKGYEDAVALWEKHKDKLKVNEYMGMKINPRIEVISPVGNKGYAKQASCTRAVDLEDLQEDLALRNQVRAWHTAGTPVVVLSEQAFSKQACTRLQDELQELGLPRLPVTNVVSPEMVLIKEAADWRSGFVVDQPKGSYREFAPADSDYPLKGVTYPTDYGYLTGYQGEDEADLDFFRGTGKEHGSFRVRRDDVPGGETKFMMDMTPEERAAVLQAFQPVLEGEASTHDEQALLELLQKFKAPSKQAAVLSPHERITRTADEAGIAWDNDPKFMAACQAITGKAHLDDMTPEELDQVHAMVASDKPAHDLNYHEPKFASVMATPNPDGTVTPLPVDPAWTGPAAIEHALKNLDLAAIEHDANEVLRRKLKSKRPAAVDRLGFLDGLKRTGLTPSDLMISRVPVIPPMFRPYSMAGATFVPGDANELYRDLLNLIGTHKKLDERLGGNFSGENRLRVYDAVRAVYGHGDPVVPKTAERGVSGFLKQITGVSPKFCYSSETEILTAEGWKYFFECTSSDHVLTLNATTMLYEWEMPTAWVNYKQGDGHMVRVETAQGSLLVTPGHTMWVRSAGVWQKIIAAELVYNHTAHLYELAVTPKAMINEPLESNTTPIVAARFEDYQGNVYCCSTQNGLLVVRRNGFCTVSGNSFLQRKLVARDQDFTGRATGTLDPDLSIDQVGIPDEMAWKLYSPYVQRRLVRAGMPPGEALQHITDRSTFAGKHLDLEMGERPVMYSRAPAWHKFNTLGGWARRTKGNSVSLNPMITTGMNADFDGDAFNVHVVSTPDAVRDVKERIMPSRMLHSIKERGAVMALPKHEYLLGIHGAQTLPSQAKHQFGTEVEALAAIRSGKVSLTDEVEIAEFAGPVKNTK